jgi:hypothetical protein
MKTKKTNEVLQSRYNPIYISDFTYGYTKKELLEKIKKDGLKALDDMILGFYAADDKFGKNLRIITVEEVLAMLPKPAPKKKVAVKKPKAPKRKNVKNSKVTVFKNGEIYV